MLNKTRNVRVHQIANQMTVKAREAMLLDLALYAETKRPQLVLDCARLLNMDSSALRLLLSCLEIVMKCNGDVRLASLSPTAEAVVRRTGISRLFEIYATPEGAIQSFEQRPYSVVGMSASDHSLHFKFADAA